MRMGCGGMRRVFEQAGKRVTLYFAHDSSSVNVDLHRRINKMQGLTVRAR